MVFALKMFELSLNIIEDHLRCLGFDEREERSVFHSDVVFKEFPE